MSVPAVNTRTASGYAVSDRPAIVLTRHFFTSLFDFGFLSDAGAESLKRALLGCLAGAFAIGLLLTRVFMAKYGALSSAPAEVYERAVVADHAFLIAVPMWIVAAAVGLVGHSLFPDQTDFRVLMAEPLSRLTIFASKLASLLLFVFLFIAGTHVALLPLVALTMIRAIETGSLLATTMAFAFSSVSGSLCAALAVDCRSRDARAARASRATAGVLRDGEERSHRLARAVVAARRRGCPPRRERSRRAHGGFHGRRRPGSWDSSAC